MAHKRLGLFCFLGRGHLNPCTALGRCLKMRGHEVIVFHLVIAQAAVRASGLQFWPIDAHESPTKARKGALNSAIKSLTTIDAVKTHAETILREAPRALQAA